MTNRIPLTEDDIDIDFIDDNEVELHIMINCQKKDYEKAEQLEQQILKDHKFYHTFHNSNVYSFTEDEMKIIREKSDKLDKIREYDKRLLAPLQTEKYIELEQENKQLKIDNDVMRKYNSTMAEGVQEQISINGNLKQKLERIEQNVRVVDYDGDRIRKQIQEILKDK